MFFIICTSVRIPIPVNAGVNESDEVVAGEFKQAYPEAKVIGVEGLAEKKKAEGLTLDGGECFVYLLP